MYTNKLSILFYLYQFRFATRAILQEHLGQKHVSRIQINLKELEQDGYVYKLPKFNVLDPYIYTLTSPGYHHLKKHRQALPYPLPNFNNTCKNLSLSPAFQQHCLLLGRINNQIAHLLPSTKFRLLPAAALRDYSDYPTPRPSAHIIIKPARKERHLLLEIFSQQLWKAQINRRIKAYEDWYDEADEEEHKPVLFVLPLDRHVSMARQQIDDIDWMEGLLTKNIRLMSTQHHAPANSITQSILEILDFRVKHQT